VPVIVLGQPQADAVDCVRAFARGCDDYLGRPFHYEELLYRIRAILRRTAPPPGDVLEAGEILVDRGTRCVSVAGRRVILPAKEYELLLKLATAPTRVFTKEELLREVWGFRSLGRTRTLDSHASRLRRKLAAASETPYVLNEWGVGYRLMLPV
jgi:DNA-binding response OmpR family regulator